jgi:hypothetical protein
VHKTRRRRNDKIVRIFKKKMPWTAHLVNDPKTAFDLNVDANINTRSPKGSRCTICKGARMLCRKTKCPILTKIQSFLKIKEIVNQQDVEGSSPPSVFIGRFGYPNVYAGPLVPPFYGNTDLYDVPERWFGKTIEEIVDFRMRLVRGQHCVNVTKPENGGRILEETQYLAMAEHSVDVELALLDRPRKVFVLNDETQPIGPSARIKHLKVGSTRLDHRIEKAYYDFDLKAADAVLDLYRSGTLVSKLQRALSVGVFGVRAQRRLVPTRWSITAVDSMISLNLMDHLKTYPLINEYQVYESHYLDNKFEIIMIPDAWKYEAIEAWYPGTIWNPHSRNIFLLGDWEDHHGRTTYARMGGCYYAARLAVAEKLNRERRQGTVIVLREARPGYIMPVGVWQVRENVRNALRQPPLKFNNIGEVLEHIGSQFYIPLNTWIENSELLKDSLIQTKITGFLTT